jgi:hypothetical protein
MSSYGQGSHEFRLGRTYNPYQDDPARYRERAWWDRGWRDAKRFYRRPDLTEKVKVGDRVRIRRIDVAGIKPYALGTIISRDGAYIMVRPLRKRWEVELYRHEIEKA